MMTLIYFEVYHRGAPQRSVFTTVWLVHWFDYWSSVRTHGGEGGPEQEHTLMY